MTPEDLDPRERLERDCADLRKAAEGFDAEVARLRERLAATEGRLEALRARKWSRLGEAIREARRRPWAVLLLPGRAARILFGRAAPMQGPPERPVPGDGTTLLGRATSALEGVAREGRPVVVAYHPVARANPYQPLLYAACAEAGIAAVPLWSLEELADAAALAARGAEVWFHLHWTSVVLSGAASRRDAERRLAEFAGALDRFRGTGGRILWTIHNVLPHEFRYPDLEAEVCRALAGRADQIQVLCANTPEIARPWYSLPAERVRVIPHCAYTGVYPDTVAPEEARRALGLAPEHVVLAAVGGIRRYKGLGGLLDAFEAASKDDPLLRLVIAGAPVNFPEIPELRARCEATPGVVARIERFPDQDLQLYLNACDVAVLPYDDVLNSSALTTALAFGRPVIAPLRGCVPGQVSPEVGVLFDPGVEGDLERAIRRARSLRDPAFRAAALRWAAGHSPRAMAERFVSLLRDAAGR